jgi:hypothetical protein
MANARWIAVCALLSACASAPRLSVSPPPVAPPPGPVPAPPAADPAYDWHGLMIAPFGSVLRDMPGALHEVLQFHDESRAQDDAEDQDCYGTNAPTPDFAGRKLDGYLLCFRHDRLVRIEATLRLAPDEAASVLARACAAWQGRCQGQEGDINFSVRLGEDSGEPELPLVVTLRNAALSP